jgi:hypothetical protein
MRRAHALNSTGAHTAIFRQACALRLKFNDARNNRDIQCKMDRVPAGQGVHMLYPELFKQLEAVRWNMDQDIPWSIFDASRLTEEQAQTIKMNAITEW